ncbi:hypothetical protein PNIG_a1417 [Pseudoalteromonas nigrifaciens]|uniref:Uncharacterized protein n=2 Tax=Pseudoalteromonas TaxID=53246 RepID=A0AAC9UHB4_9GAMM|nr:hypothetical protein PTRA_a1342 [Pseudoalteromonas translucida KMM 520]ASM53577.1 hypothetical protein PNIG_a1417 [Pseudoalteromonas nigrifaciens]SJN47652.1 hypothetical protein CZ797_15155 [Pseudoalteromonas sp. JB197]
MAGVNPTKCITLSSLLYKPPAKQIKRLFAFKNAYISGLGI